MSSEVTVSVKPRKRLFTLLLGIVSGIILALTFLLWWVPSVGLENIHPILPLFFGLLLGAVSLSIVGGLTLLILTLLTGRDLFITNWLRKMVVKYQFPAIISIGRLFGVDPDRMRRSFIALNNQLVDAKQLRVSADKILILLPHCIQMFDCPIRITGEVKKCIGCGSCDISELLGLADRYGIELAVATGGTLARRLIVNKRPELIVAVACERDLTSGIRDCFPLPVLGVLNARPQGPCLSTRVLLAEVKNALDSCVLQNSID